MSNLEKEELSKKFIKACQLGDLEIVKELYLQSSDKQGLKLKFLTKQPVFDPHYGEDGALRGASFNDHPHIVKFLLNDQNFIKNLVDKNILTKLFKNSVSNGGLITNKNFEVTTIIVPLLKEHNISHNKNILLGFIEVCTNEDMELLEYLAENFDIYSKLPTIISKNSYSLQELGFVSACEEGYLESVKFLLTSPKIKERIDLNKIITPVRITNQHILEYLVFDFGICKDSLFAKNIVNDNLSSMLEKRDIFNSLSSDLKANDHAKTTLKV